MSSSPDTAVLQARGRASAFTVRGLVRCMRPSQWIKNGFVLIPLVFSNKLRQPPMALREAAVMAAFCLVASGVYLWNDGLDWKSDLAHPEKRTRPIPSGQLSASVALLLGTMILLTGIGLAWALSPLTCLLLSSYAVI